MEKRVVFQRNWWLPYAWWRRRSHHAGLLHLARLPGAGTSFFSKTRSAFRGHSSGSTISPGSSRTPATCAAFWTTLVFGLVGHGDLSMGMALALAVAANRVIRSATTYRTFLIWPYAVAPALAGVLWFFMMNPSLGIIAYWLEAVRRDWNHYVNGNQALMMVIIAAAWKQILQLPVLPCGASIHPEILIEAAAIDGASPARRFWTIVFPLSARQPSSCWW
jgi:sn-glycerol 3-phosphate transport system permease protein